MVIVVRTVTAFQYFTVELRLRFPTMIKVHAGFQLNMFNVFLKYKMCWGDWQWVTCYDQLLGNL